MNPGDTIRIAEGTYFVDEGLSGAATRESTFFIPVGTTIWGGYPTTGNPGEGERNPLRYRVTLSGDIDRATNPDGDYSAFVAGDYSALSGNSLHVLVIDDSATVSNTLISGATVQGGNADGGFEKGNGGGIHCGDGTPFIRNCIIRYCRAKMTNSPASLFLAFDGLGGGLYSRDTYDGGLLEIRDTLFQHCHAMWGGGLYKKPTVHETPTNSVLLAGCRFIENRADRVAGGTARGGGAALDHGIGRIDLVNTEFTLNRCDNDGDETFSGAGAALHIGLPTQDEDCLGSSCGSGCGGYDECTEGCIGSGGICPDMSCEDCATNTVLTNCVFRANIGSSSQGGAVRLRRKAAFNHCVFVANTTDYGGGGAAVAIGHKAFAQFNGCIIWGNIATALSENPGLESQIFVNPAGVECFSAFNCVIQGLSEPLPSDCPTSASSGNIDADPRFVLNPDPGDDELGDLRLRPDSPCIDAGDDGLLPPDTGDIDESSSTSEDLPLDLPYRPRSVDGECGGGNSVVDMGAYEYWCFGDLNGDCAVNGMDSALLLAAWNTPGYFPCPLYELEDLDRNCTIDSRDLALLLAAWGDCPEVGGGEGAAPLGGGEESGEDEVFAMLWQWYVEEDWAALLEWALSQLPSPEYDD